MGISNNFLYDLSEKFTTTKYKDSRLLFLNKILKEIRRWEQIIILKRKIHLK